MALNTRIILSAQDRGATKAFQRLGANSTRTQKKIFGMNNALKQSNKTLGVLGERVKFLTSGAGLAGLAFGLANVAKQAIAVKIDFDQINNTLKAVSGSSSAAASELGFITKEASRLGLELRPLAQTYTRLAASTKLIGIGTAETREIFTSFSEALTTFGADRQKTIRVFAALEQIAAKGVVSMEELRQQLGEALPGAFSLAARSMNLTEQEFSKLVAQGKVLSKDFLLPFSKAVREELGKGAVTGAKLLQAEINRLTNAFDELWRQTGDALGPGLTDAIKSIRELLTDKTFIKNSVEFAKVMGAGLALAAKSAVALAKGLTQVSSALGPIGSALALLGLGKLGSGLAGRGIANVAGRLGFGGSGVASAVGTAAAVGGGGRRKVNSPFASSRTLYYDPNKTQSFRNALDYRFADTRLKQRPSVLSRATQKTGELFSKLGGGLSKVISVLTGPVGLTASLAAAAGAAVLFRKYAKIERQQGEIQNKSGLLTKVAQGIRRVSEGGTLDDLDRDSYYEALNISEAGGFTATQQKTFNQLRTKYEAAFASALGRVSPDTIRKNIDKYLESRGITDAGFTEKRTTIETAVRKQQQDREDAVKAVRENIEETLKETKTLKERNRLSSKYNEAQISVIEEFRRVREDLLSKGASPKEAYENARLAAVALSRNLRARQAGQPRQPRQGFQGFDPIQATRATGVGLRAQLLRSTLGIGAKKKEKDDKEIKENSKRTADAMESAAEYLKQIAENPLAFVVG